MKKRFSLWIFFKINALIVLTAQVVNLDRNSILDFISCLSVPLDLCQDLPKNKKVLYGLFLSLHLSLASSKIVFLKYNDSYL